MELALSDKVLLYNLDCSGNKLTQLVVSESSLFSVLDCSYNQLTYASLPHFKLMESGVYDYSPQENISLAVGDRMWASQTVGLSSLAAVGTNVLWYRATDIPFNPGGSDGVFVISEQLIGDEIWCEMSNL